MNESKKKISFFSLNNIEINIFSRLFKDTEIVRHTEKLVFEANDELKVYIVEIVGPVMFTSQKDVFTGGFSIFLPDYLVRHVSGDKKVYLYPKNPYLNEKITIIASKPENSQVLYNKIMLSIKISKNYSAELFDFPAQCQLLNSVSYATTQSVLIVSQKYLQLGNEKVYYDKSLNIITAFGDQSVESGCRSICLIVYPDSNHKYYVIIPEIDSYLSVLFSLRTHVSRLVLPPNVSTSIVFPQLSIPSFDSFHIPGSILFLSPSSSKLSSTSKSTPVVIAKNAHPKSATRQLKIINYDREVKRNILIYNQFKDSNKGNHNVISQASQNEIPHVSHSEELKSEIFKIQERITNDFISLSTIKYPDLKAECVFQLHDTMDCSYYKCDSSSLQDGLFCSTKENQSSGDFDEFIKRVDFRINKEPLCFYIGQDELNMFESLLQNISTARCITTQLAFSCCACISRILTDLVDIQCFSNYLFDYFASEKVISKCIPPLSKSFEYDIFAFIYRMMRKKMLSRFFSYISSDIKWRTVCYPRWSIMNSHKFLLSFIESLKALEKFPVQAKSPSKNETLYSIQLSNPNVEFMIYYTSKKIIEQFRHGYMVKDCEYLLAKLIHQIIEFISSYLNKKEYNSVWDFISVIKKRKVNDTSHNHMISAFDSINTQEISSIKKAGLFFIESIQYKEPHKWILALSKLAYENKTHQPESSIFSYRKSIRVWNSLRLLSSLSLRIDTCVINQFPSLFY